MRTTLLATAIVFLASGAYAQQSTSVPPVTEMKAPTDLVQATVTYLASRPYSEVAHIIAAWIRVAQQNEPKKEPGQ